MIIPPSNRRNKEPAPKPTGEFVQRIHLLRLTQSDDELTAVIATAAHLLLCRLDKVIELSEAAK